MIHIVADDKIPFLADSPLAKCTDLQLLPGAEITNADLRNADALITRTRTRCNAELLHGTPVRFIATATIGYDHIDAAYCAENGIRWTNAPGCNAASVAQYIASVLVRLPELPEGKTLGVIGAGHVGKLVIKTAQALGMQVLVNDPPRAEKEGPGGFTELPELLEKSDVVTLHPLLERAGKYPSFHLADKNFFRTMKKSAFFINASRGAVCDCAALEEALRNGTIAGAVLDVWENEPDFSRPLQNLLLFGTPHIAGYSTDGKAAGTAMSVQAVSRFFRLGCDDWFPQNVPLPAETTFELAQTGFAAVREAVLRAYDIAQDDAALRKTPEAFESLRGHYPIRREFSACTYGGTPGEKAESMLSALGFRKG